MKPKMRSRRRANDDQDGKRRDQQHDDQDGKQARPHAAEEQDADGDRDDHDEGAEVRLFEQQHADRDHGAGHRQEGLFRSCMCGILRTV